MKSENLGNLPLTQARLLAGDPEPSGNRYALGSGGRQWEASAACGCARALRMVMLSYHRKVPRVKEPVYRLGGSGVDQRVHLCYKT